MMFTTGRIARFEESPNHWLALLPYGGYVVHLMRGKCGHFQLRRVETDLGAAHRRTLGVPVQKLGVNAVPQILPYIFLIQHGPELLERSHCLLLKPLSQALGTLYESCIRITECRIHPRQYGPSEVWI